MRGRPPYDDESGVVWYWMSEIQDEWRMGLMKAGYKASRRRRGHDSQWVRTGQDRDYQTDQNAADDSKTDDTDRQSFIPDGVLKRFGTTTRQDKTRAHSCTTMPHPPTESATIQAAHA